MAFRMHILPALSKLQLVYILYVNFFIDAHKCI
ncbi:hypothetical protein AT5A_07465 [Agrobacterium tumefaciens 5A]|nr:hypothetical protein AT5A_07465 [Agrobacterium tumefaciens 5A]